MMLHFYLAMLKFTEVLPMLKGILILVLIAVLAAIGAVAALRIISWFIGVFVNIAIVVAAFIGIMFLIRKLRAG